MARYRVFTVTSETDMFTTPASTRATLFMAVVGFSAPAFSASWSGTYVASGSNVSFYLQWVFRSIVTTHSGLS